MTAKERFEKENDKLARWSSRWDRVWSKAVKDQETFYLEAIREIEAEKAVIQDRLKNQEEQLKWELETAAKEFTQTKYQLEKESSQDRLAIERVDGEFDQINKKYAQDFRRITEEKTNLQISYDKQKSALTELYQEKRRSLLVNREKLIQQSAQSEENLRRFKEKYAQEIDGIRADQDQKLNTLKDQVRAKEEGWKAALDSMRRDREVLSKQKDEAQKKITEVVQEKEQELEALKISLSSAKEQLEMDKATLIEKAEVEQRQCEKDVQDLEQRVLKADSELQELIVHKQEVIKNSEEAYAKEESMLKDAVKVETEKRDYEQKLFAQEKSDKEKELNVLKEEYEKRKWHWENQIRTLMVQKSVQDAEHDAERMRVDREARAVLRSLEAKRDELKQRQADIKSRYENLLAHSQKENDLLTQRWNWRKERLWSMWQNRLDVLKKERGVLHEQLENLEQTFSSEKRKKMEEEKRQEKRVDDLAQATLQNSEKHVGYRKQREIQFELEKTRLIAQIKECETIIQEWMDRQKLIQEEVSKRSAEFQDQMNFLDRYFKEEQNETELFLHLFRKALNSMNGAMSQLGIEKHAA